ncbi:AAA family ATPase [Longirhabdus pacifica]|uniref:AAA family ATPase n=1 Tax=Longirhabdus pacifica TaxID=2305227 RepID=UPI0010089D2E|nr:hypothetical protein [Longirhabdus pacifica]
MKQTAMLATGEPQIDDVLAEETKAYIEVVATGLSKDDVLKKTEQYKPHILIIADGIAHMEEGLSRQAFIQEFRRRFPGTRMIYIYTAKEEALDEFLRFLVQTQVYDFVSSELNLNELEQLVNKPRDYIQVKRYELLEVPDEDVQLDEAVREVLKESVVYVPQKQSCVAFYAPSATGKSFVAQNTAVKMAQLHPDVDIVLCDFDFLKPTINTRLNVKPNSMTFEQVCQQIDGERFHAEALQSYLITHPKYANLKIFDGRFSSPEFLELLGEHHLRRIIELLKEQFHIVLMDTHREPNEYVLKAASSMYCVVDYDFSHNMHFQKQRLQLAQQPALKQKAKRIIVNHAWDDAKFTPKLLEQFFKSDETMKVEDQLDTTPIASIPHCYEQQIQAVYKGKSLVEVHEQVEEAFIQICQAIYPAEIKEKKRFSLFSFLKRKEVAHDTASQTSQ